MKYLQIAAVHVDMYSGDLLELYLFFGGQNIHGYSVELLLLTASV